MNRKRTTFEIFLQPSMWAALPLYINPFRLAASFLPHHAWFRCSESSLFSDFTLPPSISCLFRRVNLFVLMAGAENDSDASFLERLMSYRNREFSVFVPLVLGVVGPSTRGDREREEEENTAEERRERLVLINPITQGMIVIQGGSNVEELIREISEMESGKSGPPPASKASIEALPSVKIVADAGDGDGDDAECAICLEDMEEAKEMPCRHRFHSNCIDKWLGMHGSCPCCRYAMPVEGEGKKSGGAAAGGEGRRREIWVSLSLSATTRSDSSTENTTA